MILSFGQGHDSNDALRINELVTILHDLVPIEVHIKIASASFESNHPHNKYELQILN